MIRRRALVAAPLAVAAGMGVGCLAMLSRMGAGNFDPHGVPNPLLHGAVPDFALDGFGARQLRAQTVPVLVNFFASWCVPCLEEADALRTLRRRGLAIWGIGYKDAPDATAAFVRRLGSPYARVALDLSGDVAIDWGVTGVPETFLVTPGGILARRFVGALDAPAVLAAL